MGQGKKKSIFALIFFSHFLRNSYHKVLGLRQRTEINPIGKRGDSKSHRFVVMTATDRFPMKNPSSSVQQFKSTSSFQSQFQQLAASGLYLVLEDVSLPLETILFKKSGAAQI